ALTFNGETSNEFALYQNVPNPFKDETVVGFVLPQAASASITIYDVSGKVLRLIEGEYVKGYNEVSINRSDLSGAGVLYYTLETADYSATKKMIVLE
ncbi:MAG: T9SS type A sorting domain-containing protein, partial [Bacteroidota bacterium]